MAKMRIIIVVLVRMHKLIGYAHACAAHQHSVEPSPEDCAELEAHNSGEEEEFY